jgi:hypothetical protein
MRRVDLADSFDYVSKVQALAPAIASAGVRVLTACSSVSAVSAALIRLSGVSAPVRVSTFRAGHAQHVDRRHVDVAVVCAHRPVRVVRDGALVERRAFSQARAFEFPPPIGRCRRGSRGADALTLPSVWPSLRESTSGSTREDAPSMP